MTTFKKVTSIALCLMTLVCAIFALSSCDVLGIGKFDVNYLVDGEIYRTEVGSFASDVTLPEDPVKNGYSFDGWYLDDGEWNVPFSSETAKKKLNLADMSVYAKFTNLTYSIKYETLGGKHSNPATYTVTSENINLEPASHDNYKFVGWYTDSSYTNEIKSLPTGSFGDLTLYAKYAFLGYTVDYSKALPYNEASNNGINDLFIVAQDDFGNALTPTATLKSGEYKGGSYVVYEIALADATGVVEVFDTVEIPVYDVNDIDFSYFAKKSPYIKLTSCGEEFDAVATDSFGNLCTISIELLDGFTAAGGEIVSLRLVATDAAGNRKVSEEITDIQIYDFPTITYDDELLPVLDNAVDLSTLFSTADSFGGALPFEISVSDELVAGGAIVITVTTTDIAGQTTTENFEFNVYDSTKPYVKLYVDGALWDIVTIEDSASYTLPLFELDEAFDTAGWLDVNGKRYTDSEGTGLLSVTSNTKLYYSVIKSGYLPIFTVEDLFAMTPDNNYYLFADLNLGLAEWIPVGTEDAPFAGEFIGQGHTISSLKIAESNQYAGFFGYFSGSVNGLTLKDISITTTFDTYCYAGSLIGYNNGGSVTDCHASGKLITAAGYSKIGGLVGYNYCGTVESSTSSAQVSASAVYYCYIGGLIGDSYQGNITDCSATGEVKITPTCDTGYAGGLVGYNNEGTVERCYATGLVSASASRIIYTGGLVGSNSGAVRSSYARGNVTSTANSGTNVIISYTGGLIGRNLSGEVTECYATGNANSSANAKYCSSYAGGLIGYDFSGVITNCFTLGNVASLSSYESSYGGGIAGYCDGSTIVNCYRAESQTFTITRGAETTYEPTNFEGTVQPLEDLKSAEWIQTSLWTESFDEWDFSGEYPTLIG